MTGAPDSDRMSWGNSGEEIPNKNGELKSSPIRQFDCILFVTMAQVVPFLEHQDTLSDIGLWFHSPIANAMVSDHDSLSNLSFSQLNWLPSPSTSRMSSAADRTFRSPHSTSSVCNAHAHARV